MGIPIGGTAVLTLTVRDQNQTPQDPATVLITYRDPAGNKTGPTAAGVIKDSVGNYHFQLALTLAGRWLAKFTGTGTFAGASPDIEIVCNPSQL